MDTIGGFRLVRRLGSGGRAEVHLGHSTASIDGAPPHLAALKVFRPTTTLTSIDEEIDALARLSSPYLLSLLDLAITGDGRPVLILERLAPVTCSRLILDREHLTAGEAVTVLAPMADAVDELALVGVVHGGIRLDRLGFDAVGTPVLLGFGHARVVVPILDGGAAQVGSLRGGANDPLGGRAGHAGDAARPVGYSAGVTGYPARTTDATTDAACTGDATDTVDLAQVARSVLGATEPTRESAELIDWLAAPIDDPIAFRAELRDRLFDLADPEPVMVEGSKRRAIGAMELMPGRGAAHDTGQSTVRGAPDWLAATHLPAWVQDMLPTRGATPVRTLVRAALAAVRRFLAPVRRPVWAVAGGIAALLVAALVVSGTGSAGEARAAADPGGAATESTAPLSGPPTDNGGAAGAADARGADTRNAAATGAPEAGSDRGDTEAISGDDVVAAASALLRGRADCLRQQSVLCLDGIEQQGSAALETDTALVRARQEGGPAGESIDLSGATPTVTEHLGGTVILSLGLPGEPDIDPVPASLLLVRGEEGWRIRDLIVG